ncbi:hypothetical protein [Spiroplasma sp. DGKH1]|uniref:hypothetical protein n=1 Tax=Spiroplasma sp. DGKH1 TaxID=3050074 RepID=UPI0034C6CDB1
MFYRYEEIDNQINLNNLIKSKETDDIFFTKNSYLSSKIINLFELLYALTVDGDYSFETLLQGKTINLQPFKFEYYPAFKKDLQQTLWVIKKTKDYQRNDQVFNKLLAKYPFLNISSLKNKLLTAIQKFKKEKYFKADIYLWIDDYLTFILKKFTNIYSKLNLMIKRNNSDLKLAFPYVQGVFQKRKVFRCPLLLWGLHLNQTPGNVTLQLDFNNIVVNPIFRWTILKANKINTSHLLKIIRFYDVRNAMEVIERAKLLSEEWGAKYLYQFSYYVTNATEMNLMSYQKPLPILRKDSVFKEFLEKYKLGEIEICYAMFLGAFNY